MRRGKRVTPDPESAEMIDGFCNIVCILDDFDEILLSHGFDEETRREMLRLSVSSPFLPEEVLATLQWQSCTANADMGTNIGKTPVPQTDGTSQQAIQPSKSTETGLLQGNECTANICADKVSSDTALQGNDPGISMNLPCVHGRTLQLPWYKSCGLPEIPAVQFLIFKISGFIILCSRASTALWLRMRLDINAMVDSSLHQHIMQF